MPVSCDHSSDAWDHAITAAVTDPDPVRANSAITRCHRDLGRALAAVVGRDAGPNFHTWAVWGSVKAGETIRGEGFALAACLLTAAGATLGLALGAVWIGAALGWLVALVAWRRAIRNVLAGNRTVLDDIGRVTARFVAAIHADPRNLDRFLAELPDSQSLLRRAFSLYHAARFATVDERRALTLKANCLAVLHEHLRLQPYIAGAMPPGLRWFTTAFLMSFRVGPLRLSVSSPVGGTAGATDWSDLDNRMRYVFALFREYHDRGEVEADPPVDPTPILGKCGSCRLRPVGPVRISSEESSDAFVVCHRGGGGGRRPGRRVFRGRQRCRVADRRAESGGVEGAGHDLSGLTRQGARRSRHSTVGRVRHDPAGPRQAPGEVHGDRQGEVRSGRRQDGAVGQGVQRREGVSRPD